MSTRAYVRIIKNGSEPVHFHHHCDGYPSGVGEDLVNLLKDYKGEWSPTQLGEYINVSDNDFEFIDHGPSWDHEYFYIIDCDKKELCGYYKGITVDGDEIDGYDKLFIDGNIFDGRESFLKGDVDLDWPSFRREAAKDILCSLVSDPNVASVNESTVTASIKLADELIKQLREGQQ